jgi:alpha(1,3/1,4) fucosyltransferase
MNRSAPIRIACRDFPGDGRPERLLRLLATRFPIQEVQADPDYVIHSVSGYSFLKDTSAIRIAFFGENVRPDFNLSDYAFAYDWMTFGDRYYRAPNYMLYAAFLQLAAGTPAHGGIPFADRRFCNFLYSNADAHPMRDRIFDRLSRIRQVDSAGGYRRNVAPLSVKAYKDDWDLAAVAWQSQYRFSISVENSSTPGYSTEKLVHALAAGTIPIYFGDPLIDRVFNPGRFINVHELGLDAAVEQVRRLDGDPEAFADMVAQPVFRDGAVPRELTASHLLDAFGFIFGQPKEFAFRRNPHCWGRIYEDRCRRPCLGAARGILRRAWQRFGRWSRPVGIRRNDLTT